MPDATRYPSGAEALANGGREEVFFIGLPDDRLGSPRAARRRRDGVLNGQIELQLAFK